MGKPRIELHRLLQDISDEGIRVYYQPPSTIRMQYPCIVYERSKIEGTHANNQVYKTDIQYTVTVIYTDPDDFLPVAVSKIPTARHSGHFVTDNLYHDVFTIYF